MKCQSLGKTIFHRQTTTTGKATTD